MERRVSSLEQGNDEDYRDSSEDESIWTDSSKGAHNDSDDHEEDVE